MNETYLRRQRHILLDMHIPDWDERFLSRFDPKSFADLCAKSGADAVMIYCNSHAGQCYWPTKSGKFHASLAGRDIVGQLVELLHDRDLAVSAYYSAIFNTWAYTEHPDWRIIPSGPGGAFGEATRYGVCCPNNGDYMKFMVDQTDELVSSYSFDAFFYDMVFWPDVCVCASCRDRYAREEAADIPKVVDWHSGDWCRFQAARERWLADGFRQLRDTVKGSIDIPVFLNGIAIGFDWIGGLGHEIAALNDLLGGDFRGRSQFPTFARLSPTVMQYMKATSEYAGATSQLKSVDEQKAHALAATAFGGQFMAIDAVDPDGLINPAAYELLSEVFSAMQPYESYLGGTPIADFAVYWSLDSNVSFHENGVPLDQVSFQRERFRPPGPTSPHLRAVQGAVSALMQAHLPVGVITRADLDKLSEFPVIVLPNVLRMSHEEIEAFRDYVEQGGRVYASGYTSVVTTDGTRHEDFLFAELFGCNLVGEETAAIVYLKPAAAEVADWIAPVHYAPHGEPRPLFSSSGSPVTALRVSVDGEARQLATTTLPYGDGRGTRDDHEWASTHVSPPWLDTPHPAVLRNRFGQGEVVYSIADLESARGGSSDSARLLFIELVRALLHRTPTFEADTHPDVWMTAFNEPEQRRLRLCFLNHPESFPAHTLSRVPFRVSPPDDATFVGLSRIPTGEPVPFSLDEDGGLRAEIHELQHFEMLAAAYT